MIPAAHGTVDCEALEYEQTPAGEDVPFFTEIARRTVGPVLDLGCGTGRLSIPLAEAGLEVVGLDISENMIAAFRRKLRSCRREIRQRINLVRADMRQFALKQRFACAVCSSNTLLLMGSERSVERALACVARHLRDDGLFVVDVAAIDKTLNAAFARYGSRDVPDATFEMADGTRLQRMHSVRLIPARDGRDSERVALTYAYYDEAGNKLGRRAEELALIDPEKLLAVVERGGLRVMGAFGWYDRRPYSADERKLLILAKKRG